MVLSSHIKGRTSERFVFRKLDRERRDSLLQKDRVKMKRHAFHSGAEESICGSANYGPAKVGMDNFEFVGEYPHTEDDVWCQNCAFMIDLFDFVIDMEKHTNNFEKGFGE